MIDFAGIGKVFLLGDIHGMFPPFHAFARHVPGRGMAVVQIGDFGHGSLDHCTAAVAGDFFGEHAGTCGFIRGNHDAPGICRIMPDWHDDLARHGSPIEWKKVNLDGEIEIDSEKLGMRRS